VAFANPLDGARRVQPMLFFQIICRSWLVVLLATSPGIARSQEQPVRLETVTVVGDRLPVGAADEPFSGTAISREEE
jgi:hypothetical protein